MKRNKKQSIYYLFILLILGISIGYAYLNTTLNINGTTNVSSASWNVYWNNIQLGSNNVTTVTTPATISTGKTEVSFNVDFKEPGDIYEFTVDAVNDGTIDAMISTFSKGVYAANGTTQKTLPDYLEYTVTYSDGIEIANKQLLESGKTETYKVRVHYKEDIIATQLPSTDDNYMFKFSVTYVQADETGTKVAPDPDTFSTDSWSAIIRSAKKGTACSTYSVGDTKTIDMGVFGTHTIRISNCSRPSECDGEGFSQTACGFVLEFADIITTHNMNPAGEYKEINYTQGWSVDGWPASSMRTYVNSDIYNALPEVLRNAIINTTVVSGYCERRGETNLVSTDKLYLLSTKEVGDPSSFDNSNNKTRILDYYNLDNTNNKRIKNYNELSTKWWLRSAHYDDVRDFYLVDTDGVGGQNHYDHANSNYGVSPAFRIA